jgi:4-hydroxy-3-methylbut-2-enyl diphosphate reductase IspH
VKSVVDWYRGWLAAATQQVSGANEQLVAIAQTTTTVDEFKTIAEQPGSRAQEEAEASQRTVRQRRRAWQAPVKRKRQRKT